MTCSVLQTNPDPATVDQLKLAFQNVPGLTQMDAFSFGRDAFGLLARALAPDHARALQTGFAAQGVETEVVEDASLPVLPQLRMVHKLDPAPEALMICDPLGRSFPLPWQHVMMVAAGLVQVSEFKSVEVARVVRPGPHRQLTVVHEHESKEERFDHWLVDVVITGGTLRYNVVADRPGSFLFQYLGDRKTRNLATDFKQLIQDLAARAPNATVNRGASCLCQNTEKPFRYPSKTAFYNEMIWLLWKMK